MSSEVFRIPSNPFQHAPANETPPALNPAWRTDGAERDKARIRCYSRYLPPGSLAFDVGANVGEVTTIMLAMGCRVVAVEPDPDVALYIDHRAERVVAACGAAPAEAATFYRIAAAPAMSSMRHDVALAAQDTNGGWTNVPITVPVVTLDQLIAEHGVPAFTKIDVEGFEVEVFRGLSQALPALSFEVHSFDLAKIGACLAELERLGDYGLMYSAREEYLLEPFPPREYAWFGDVYATLRS